jgi:uncharacterized protein (TIGR02246 family)
MFGMTRGKNTMTIEEAIKNADTQFTEAFNQRNVGRLIDMYAEDALLLSPGSPEVRGREAIMAGFQELMDAGWNNIALSTVEISSDGGLGYHVGKFAADVPADDGSSKRETGKYTDIYKRREDGSWQIHVTMFNSDTE